jgi:hypothetical protein
LALRAIFVEAARITLRFLQILLAALCLTI